MVLSSIPGNVSFIETNKQLVWLKCHNSGPLVFPSEVLSANHDGPIRLNPNTHYLSTTTIEWKRCWLQKWHTRASILVLVGKFPREILPKMLEVLKPIASANRPPQIFLGVNGSEHVGHKDFPKILVKSSKQALQKVCPQEVTWGHRNIQHNTNK